MVAILIALGDIWQDSLLFFIICPTNFLGRFLSQSGTSSLYFLYATLNENFFLDIARAYLKQKSKGKYVIYVTLNIHQRILKTLVFAKTSMSSSTKFQSEYSKSTKGGGRRGGGGGGGGRGGGGGVRIKSISVSGGNNIKIC